MPGPDVYTLPDDLPVLEDDGACDHLPGRSLPALRLRATTGMRVTLVIGDGEIVKAFDPVFPPDRNAADVLAWLG